MVAAQSPRLLYSATLGIAAIILATPTGLWKLRSERRSELNKTITSEQSDPLSPCTMETWPQPHGGWGLAAVFARVAEYSNPGLLCGSPSGKCPNSRPPSALVEQPLRWRDYRALPGKALLVLSLEL